MAIFEAGTTKTTGAAAGMIAVIQPAALGSGVGVPEILEVGIFNQSGVAAQIGIGIPAANGTGALTSVTVQDIGHFGRTGATTLGTTYATTQPTAPSTFFRRADLQAVSGAGIIWTWLQGEWALWVTGTATPAVIWQISASAVTYDVYVKVREP